jgi:hypothetical protein
MMMQPQRYFSCSINVLAVLSRKFWGSEGLDLAGINLNNITITENKQDGFFH